MQWLPLVYSGFILISIQVSGRGSGVGIKKHVIFFFSLTESRMLNCVNEEQVSKWVCGKYAPIYLFQLSLLIYSSWQHLFILAQESL